MSENTVPNRIMTNPAQQPGETQLDYRQRIALLRAEAVERRRLELSEQCSPASSAADRIRTWERLHQLPLPRSADHRLMSVIATNTRLSLEEVLAEQRARAAPKVTAPPG